MWQEEERETLLASVSPALHPSSVAHCSVCSHKCLCVIDSYFQAFILLDKLTVITKDPLEVRINQTTPTSRCCDIRTDGQTEEHPPVQKVSR